MWKEGQAAPVPSPPGSQRLMVWLLAWEFAWGNSQEFSRLQCPEARLLPEEGGLQLLSAMTAGASVGGVDSCGQ